MSDVLKRGREIAESIGLTVIGIVGDDGRGYSGYRASEIHKLLGESVKMKTWGTQDAWYPETKDLDFYTHKALLIAIKPIKVESEERKLLRELLGLLMPNYERGDFAFADAHMEKRNSIIERAKELLGTCCA